MKPCKYKTTPMKVNSTKSNRIKPCGKIMAYKINFVIHSSYSAFGRSYCFCRSLKIFEWSANRIFSYAHKLVVVAYFYFVLFVKRPRKYQHHRKKRQQKNIELLLFNYIRYIFFSMFCFCFVFVYFNKTL